MNTGQSLLTLGALMLITITILNFYGMMNNIESALDYSRFRLEAVSVLTSRIEQVSQYFFDEASTDTSNASTLGDFSAPSSLGLETGETNFDDIDDFNGVTLQDTGRSGVIYNVSFAVDYISLQGSGQISHSNQREYHKRVRVSVTDSYNPPLLVRTQNGVEVRDTLRVSYIVSYWFYN